MSTETIFSDPNFDPVKCTLELNLLDRCLIILLDANDAFISRTLPEARTLVKELHAEKDATSAKMTRKVLQNYKTLLDASKEVTGM